MSLVPRGSHNRVPGTGTTDGTGGGEMEGALASGALVSGDGHAGSPPGVPHEFPAVRVDAIREQLHELGAPAWGMDAQFE